MTHAFVLDSIVGKATIIHIPNTQFKCTQRSSAQVVPFVVDISHTRKTYLVDTARGANFDVLWIVVQEAFWLCA